MFGKKSKTEIEAPSYTHPLDADAYLKERYSKALKWYEDKADSKHNWYRIMSVLQIAFGAMIPLISGLASSEKWMPWIVGILGALVTAITGYMKTFRFQDLWAEYRATAESLKREQSLFSTQCEPYDGEESLSVFVTRIEDILTKENSTWVRSFSSKSVVSVSNDKPNELQENNRSTNVDQMSRS